MAELEVDLYREGAAIAFEVPYDQVARWQRQLFKERCFMLIYRSGTTKDNVRELIKAVAEALRGTLFPDVKLV